MVNPKYRYSRGCEGLSCHKLRIFFKWYMYNSILFRSVIGSYVATSCCHMHLSPRSHVFTVCYCICYRRQGIPCILSPKVRSVCLAFWILNELKLNFHFPDHINVLLKIEILALKKGWWWWNQTTHTCFT